MCVLPLPAFPVESTPSDRLEAAFTAAGLTALERHVVRERLAGRSFGQIGQDAAIRRTRQNVQDAEARAMRRLSALAPGRPSLRSVAEAVHASERIDGAIRLRERGRLTVPGDLCNIDVTVPFHARHTPAEKRHELAVRRFFRLRGEKNVG